MIRQFEQSLQDVKDLLLQMGEKVEIAIDKAVKSLVNLDEKMAREVLDSDSEMDELENQIDDRVAKLIVTQQPVAKDLRRLIAAMKIATDMERMADYACNIARVTLRLVESGQPLFKKLEDIPRMARITQQMVHDGINSYIDGNVELSKQLAQRDDEVDRLYHAVVKELLERMIQRQQFTEAALHLSFVARYLERIADHATNVAESIVYIETGKRADLN
ncbi:phosphate transport system protein [Planifilum fulgidum]|uniref:Phosphate-specific transport system accessory protein PhoU n=1 Tax=Planifilum fulgidum TaxID=201973 RepID=A0A1I2PRW6_9BACL|nr:phosphate signaling complex protein PhoU [Planifilum fulgidum]MBO2497756.1 phosphate transport system regulatory protein PhoU [Bacillota bacterium]MBO2533080.1 phosphate transport system regulatory protein PhoU [Thermoactinomycetaceae bacterium]SFG16356.1 phosphate transport system protein [Planifilum fulgidum]